MALSAGPVLISLGLAGGYGSDKFGHWAGGKVFGEGSDGQKITAFTCALLGGLVSGKGGHWFDTRYQIKFEGLGSNLGNSGISIQPRLGYQSVPIYKTPYPLLSKLQKSILNEKLRNRIITREEYKRLDWDRRFANRRRRGIQQFWANERVRLTHGEDGARNWTEQQKLDIISGNKPKFNGQTIEGHHKFNALDYPHIASNPDNIYPATRAEHLQRWHRYSWRNDTSGEPLNPDFQEEF